MPEVLHSRAPAPTRTNEPLTPLGFVALLTLIACVVTGLSCWSWVPVAIGGVVMGCYLGLEMSDALHARRGRSP